LSKTDEAHEKWKGFCESKVRLFLQKLEDNANNYKCLEFRPWPKSFNIGNREKEEEGGFKDETYYFGVRVKKVGNMHTDIDLSAARSKYWEKLNNMVRSND